MVVQVAHTVVKFLEQWNHCVLTFPRADVEASTLL